MGIYLHAIITYYIYFLEQARDVGDLRVRRGADDNPIALLRVVVLEEDVAAPHKDFSGLYGEMSGKGAEC